MHGRPPEYKHKLKEPKAAEAYKKKARGLFAAHLCSGVLRVSPAPLCARRICWGITRMEQPRLWSKRACVRRRQCDAADKRRAPPPMHLDFFDTNKDGVISVLDSVKGGLLFFVCVCAVCALRAAPPPPDRLTHTRNTTKQQQKTALRCLRFAWEPFNTLLSTGVALLLHAAFSYASQSSWIPDPFLRIYTANAHQLVHGSRLLRVTRVSRSRERRGLAGGARLRGARRCACGDAITKNLTRTHKKNPTNSTDAIDREGRFVPAKFEATWTKYAAGGQSLGLLEIFALIAGQARLGDVFGV